LSFALDRLSFRNCFMKVLNHTISTDAGDIMIAV